MKKLSVIVLTVLMSLALCVNALGADALNLSLSAAQQGNKNAVVSVNVSADSQLYTTEFFVLFNADELSFKKGSEKPGNACGGISPYITANEVEAGKLKVSYTATTALENGGELLSLEFEVEEDCETEFEIETEHAETFDGKDIKPLEFSSSGTAATLQKTAKPLQTALAIAVPAAAAVIIAVALKKKKR